MPRFAANLSFLFQEVPFLDRFAAAASAGFRAVEFMFPYDHPPATVAERLTAAGLENVLFNLSAGDWAAGDRGLACLPEREEEFRSSVATALSYAAVLKTPRLHAMAGIVPPGAIRAGYHSTYIANLRYAAQQLAPAGITLLIEPINTRDMPGYFLNTQSQAAEICAAVGLPNLKIQMDCYHMQIAEGDLATKLRRYAALCGHVQIAGVPERNEPDTGEINYPYLFKLLDDLGYEGWIGCEYRPAGKTQDGLGWLKWGGPPGPRRTSPSGKLFNAAE
jgi:2-dehydrotetronate isomerase